MPAPPMTKMSPVQSPWGPRGTGSPHLAPRGKGVLRVCAMGGTSALGHGDGVPSRTHTAHRGSLQRGLCPCRVLWQRAGDPKSQQG